MKINNKIKLFFLTVFFTAMIIFGLGLFFLLRNDVRQEVYYRLEVVTEARKNHLEGIIKENKRAVKLMSISSIFKDFLSTDMDELSYKNKFDLITKTIKSIAQEHDDFLEIDVLNQDRLVIASTKEEIIGQDLNRKDIDLNFLEDIYVSDIYISKETKKPIVYMSVAIFEEGVNIGAVAVEIDANFIFSILTDYKNWGNTGETYLVNKDNLMISPSRFKENTILRQIVDTENSKNCNIIRERGDENLIEDYLGHKSTSIYLSYRGVNTIGTHSYIKEMDWCLISEFDETEIMIPVFRLSRIFIYVFLAIFIFYYFFTKLLSKRISSPIEKLRKGVEIIEKGDLNYKVATGTNDEIGELSQAFDKMTAAIKKTIHETNKKVKEQTKEIIGKEQKLKDQQKAILNVLEDVEGEKRGVAKERDRIYTILHSIGDGVFVVDRDFKVLMFNKMASKISGIGSLGAISKEYDKVLKFINEETGKQEDGFIKEIFSSKKTQETFSHAMLVKRNGVKVPVASSAAALKNRKGKVIGCVVVFRDVSKEKEIDKAKTEFVSLASHQLRTPLSAINWYTEMLLAGDAGKINDEQKNYLDEIYKGNQRMVALVNSLLNVSRLELGTFMIEPENVELLSILKNNLTELTQKIKEKNIKIVEDTDEQVNKYLGDAKLLNIIFQNLLSNAVKYTKNNGEIKISLKKEKDDIILTVSDTGVGIPKKQQKKIFTKLFRADNVQAADTEGTGLGLYIVKSIIDNVSGKIWFKSEENKGTTFFVKLPAKGMKKRVGSRRLGN